MAVAQQAGQHISAEPTDRDLVATVAAGGRPGERAMKQLFMRHRSRVRQVFWFVKLPADLHDDTGQEVWSSVWHQASRYDPAQGEPLAWIDGIANNKARAALRTRARRLRRDDPLPRFDTATAGWQEEVTGPAPSTPDRLLELRQLQDCVRAAFGRFRSAHPMRAWLLLLHHAEGWSMEQIAASREGSVDAAKQFLKRARTLAKDFFDPCLGRDRGSGDGAASR